MNLIALTIAWSVGLWIAHQWAVPSWAIIGLASIAALLQIVLWRAKRRTDIFLVLALVLGMWRLEAVQPPAHPPHLGAYTDTGWCTVTGYVVEEPSIRDTWTQLVIEAETIEQAGRQSPAKGRFVCHVSPYPQFAYGDRLSVSGLLQTPPILDTFDYREYLASRGIYAQMQRTQVTQLQGTAGSAVLRAILAAKEHTKTVIDRILPYPEAGLLNGILLGFSHTLPSDIDEDLQRSGLTHIVVISGYNVSMVIVALLVVSRRFLHRWLAIGLALIGTLFYLLLVGASPPVTRAAIMAIVMLGGQWLGRKSHLLTSLALASLVMTAINPLVLWSVSFQLSFVATLALIAVEPLLSQRWQQWLAQQQAPSSMELALRAFGSLLIASVVAQAATLPLLWYHFQQTSLWALLANVLVLPLQPAIISLGVLATVLGLIHPLVGQIAGWIVWPFLRLTILIAGEIADLPGVAVRLPAIPGVMVWLLYGLASALVIGRKLNRESSHKPITPSKSAFVLRWGILALGLFAVLVWVAVFTLPDGRLHVYMLDVGQGDAILIESPTGTTALIDGGADPIRLASCLGRVLPFWQKHLDLIVSTHVDQDHLAGLIPLLSNYQIDTVIESPVMPDNDLCQAWHQALQKRQLVPLTATKDLAIWLDTETLLTVLHPDAIRIRASADTNRTSVVTRLTMLDFEMLLTADIDLETEKGLLATKAPLQADVLKVAHHGAKSSSSAEFIEAVSPQVALIGVGEDNQFGHPSTEVLENLSAVGCQTLRADRDGTIECVSDGQRLWIYLHR